MLTIVRALTFNASLKDLFLASFRSPAIFLYRDIELKIHFFLRVKSKENLCVIGLMILAFV